MGWEKSITPEEKDIKLLHDGSTTLLIVQLFTISKEIENIGKQVKID